MNPIQQTNAYWDLSEIKADLKPTARLIYLALLQVNNRCGWKNPFQATYGQILSMTGISNVKTYYSALEELVKGEYLTWEKGPNQYQAASFSIKVLYQKTEEHGKSTGKADGGATEEHGKSTGNILKPINSKPINNKMGVTPPTPDQVSAFFESKQKSKNMAEAFYNHYAANGWIQNKGKPIVDWQAAARGWISREATFSGTQTGIVNQENRLSGAEIAQKRRDLAKAAKL